MSTTAEKEQKAPMGSFLTKLNPPKEKKDEPAKNEATPEAGNKPADVVVKAEPVAEKVETKPEANPEAEKEPEGEDKAQLEKRLKDTQTWANELNKKFRQLEKENKELRTIAIRTEQKIDGTYEPQATPSAEQLTYDAEMRGKLRASHRAAVRKHGEEHVMANVWMPDSPYQKLQEANPLVAQRVLASDDPVQEALDVLKEEEDAKKYGRTSEEMRKKIEDELKQKITQEVLNSLKTKPGPAVNTMGIVRGESERTQQHQAPDRLDLGAVFPHGRRRT